MLKNFLHTLFGKKYQFSLAILIPLFLVIFVAGPFSIVINTINAALSRSSPGAAAPDDILKILSVVKAVLWVSLGAAFATGLVLSYSILSPLRNFFRRSGFIHSDSVVRHEEDLDILGRDIGYMMSSVGQHVSILSGMSGGVVAFDSNGLVTAVNPSAENLFACRSKDLLGKSVTHVCQNSVTSPEMERVIRDGLEHGNMYTSAEAHISGSNRKSMIVGITTSILTGQDGMPSGLVANFMNLSGVREMHEDLQQRLRLAGLGRLAANVAHEVRNPLGAIKGMAQLIKESPRDSDSPQKYAAVIEQETDRLNKVVEDLLSLSQSQNEKVMCDIRSLLSQARELALHALSNKQAKILFENGNTPEIKAECGRLVQAFLNLFMNAFEAVPDGGMVRVTTIDQPECKSVSIEIANSGVPVPAEVKERMFEPFFTTKEKGTGLGLAIAHQIITTHGGTISVESTDKETVFKIVLPLEE